MAPQAAASKKPMIENERLDDDTLQGFIWIRSDYYDLLPADGFIPGECTATIPFTGRRVKA